MVLGIEPNYPFTVNRRKCLHDGHVIAIGTDGVWDTCNILDEFRAGRKADDDITLVLVKVQKK